jgi:hypothetical protein
MHQVLFRGEPAPLESFALGATRIAGPPDLPAGTDWPSLQGRRLPLVFQLALADVAAFPATPQLPSGGTLWFFAAQLADWPARPTMIDVPAAVRWAPVDAGLVRATLPPEATDEIYWDTFAVSRIVEWRPSEAETEDDEDRDDRWHVLFPTRKESSAWGLLPPDGFVSLLEMRSDYTIDMNWGDGAWATWVLSSEDLRAHRFDRATAYVWIG